MVEPAGAMAMFVLRLAGLLSLENALKDQEANLTYPGLNLTSLGFNHTTSNLTWPDTELHVVGSVSQGEELPPPVAESSPSTPITHNPTVNITSYRIDASLNYLSTLPTAVNSYTENDGSNNDKESSPSQSSGRSLRKGGVTNDAIETLPTASPLSATRNLTAGGSVHSFPHSRRGEEDTETGQSQEVLLRAVDETGGAVHSRGDREGIGGPGSHREPAVVGRSSEAEGTVQTGRGERSGAPSGGEGGEPPSPVDSHTPKGVDPSMSPLSESRPTASLSGRSRPRLEALLEEDDVSGLIDGHKHAGLEEKSEDFDELDFEHYDFESHPKHVTPRPTLPSLSLVSPVPVRVPPRSLEPTTPSLDLSSLQPLMEHSTRKPAPARPRKTPQARPIPRSNPQRPRNPQRARNPQRPRNPQRAMVRNNPYPYGPKRLPGPYAPLTPNLPPAGDNSRERPLTEYNYEDDPDYYYDSEEEHDSRYEVQTKEPPVLFVFDKPGYSPEPPTTVIPSTRAPTPSDPWDCAPRCPRYTLLDWNMDYDVRQYPETLWVSTVIISDNRVLAELEGYMRVQDYFYGLNDQGLLLNLTVPFVTQVKFGKHPGVLQETNDYTVSLYVQPAYYQHGELPTPISNEVLVDELEAKTVFVHNFEANVWDVTETFLEEKVTSLMQQLRHNGEAFLDRYYYLASYSRPELYQTVYYEVWIYATNFRDPHTSTKTSTPHRRPQTNKITQKTLSKLCRGVECPKFEVLRTYKYGIQKRRYYDGLFASSSPKECQFTTMSVWKGFMPLHLYKHGINSHMEVIEATRPIALVHVKDSTSPSTECPQNLTMSLYLPRRLHSNPPITGYAAPSVHITALDDVIVYAYTVGGYLLDPARVRRELSDMKYRLSEFGACYKDDEHFVVIYDFIVRYHGRQNEIWIVAENCKATHNG